jgi:hypothetical protein
MVVALPIIPSKDGDSPYDQTTQGEFDGKNRCFFSVDE